MRSNRDVWKIMSKKINLANLSSKSLNRCISETIGSSLDSVMCYTKSGQKHIWPNPTRFGTWFLDYSNFFVIQSYEFRFGKFSALCLKTSNPRSFWKTLSRMDSRNYRKQQQENVRENWRIHNLIVLGTWSKLLGSPIHLRPSFPKRHRIWGFQT